MYADCDIRLLLDLDDDIIIEIFQFLDVPSILVLRKTCRRMLLISRLTVIWRHALITQVIEHGYPVPSDALSPGISQNSLEHIVLRSCLTAKFWLDPTATSRSELEIRVEPLGISEIRLLPEDLCAGLGKRRVVTVSKGIWSRVVCWEFDMNNNQLSRLAEWSPKGAILTGITVNENPRSEATIAVSLNVDCGQCIQLLSLRNSPSLQVMKSFTTGSRPIYLNGDTIIFSDDFAETYVSNWRTGESAVLLGVERSADNSFEYNKCMKIVYAHNSILVVRARCVDLFPIPKLKPPSTTIPVYRAIATHTFGWVDGVSVYPQHQSYPKQPHDIAPLHILVRSENDDPWSSDTHTIHLYNLEVNPEYEGRFVEEQSPAVQPSHYSQPSKSPYIFPPIHKVSFPTIRGRLRCTDIHCGDRGTTIWIQPRPAHETNLTAFDVHSSRTQAAYRVPGTSAKETLLGSVFPGVMMDRNGDEDGKGLSGKHVRKLLERDRDSEANWTAMDYDEVEGLVVLGASDGKVTVVKL